jgi:hypothetical protein
MPRIAFAALSASRCCVNVVGVAHLATYQLRVADPVDSLAVSATLLDRPPPEATLARAPHAPRA